ncbi:MFS general substrate transporter [Neolentinus lepideus HHB14362 ss-1]|uniref:MFS general substrate transporter n=1 Tax=Neolentinus lepideus HHB14362 ss-1 TaxID=1314782 RepID=A0A165NJ91_9AGAM|nr:MFS general substrate transporter [Neolentinus lepideus HHB14362 ss-1]
MSAASLSSFLFTMSDLLRETFIGGILNIVSKGKLCPYPDQQPGFRAPEHYYQEWQAAHPDAIDPYGHRPSTSSTTSDATAINPNTGSATATKRGIAGEKGPTPDQKTDGRVEEPTQSTDTDTEKGWDPNLVTWYGPDDPENPRNWSSAKKAFVTSQLCLLTFSVYIGSSIYTAGIVDLTMQFGVSITAATLGLTLFVIGYGVGPMFLSPLSEVPALGRMRIYIITLAIFVCIQVPTALCDNLGALLPLRFVAGFIGSPCLATGGASIADIYIPRKRAYAIGIWGISAVCGPVLGPLLGGFAADAEDWRWTIWILLWLSGGTLAFLIFCLPETSGANILHKRARRLRKLTGNENLKTEGEIEQAHMSVKEAALMTLVRPFILMLTEPIVFFLNLYIALVYGLLYLWFEAFPIVYIVDHGFNGGQEGLAFLGIFVGALIGYLFFCIYCYFYLEKQFEQDGMYIVPEKRLLPAFAGGILLPISIFWFGWTSSSSIPWIVPTIGSAFFGMGTFILFQAVLNYLGDAYPRYGASVLAGNDFFRSGLGAAFPLFARAMFNNLGGPGGVAWGSTLVALLSVVMIPIPWVLWKYGARIRKYSKYAD